QTLTLLCEKGANLLSMASLGYRAYRICHQLDCTINKILGKKSTSELFSTAELFNTFASPTLSLIQIGDKIIQFFATTFFGVTITRDLTLDKLDEISKQLNVLHTNIVSTIRFSH